MVLQTQVSSVIYAGDNVSVDFAVIYPFYEPGHLQVSTGTGEVGSVDSVLELGTDYTVTGGAGGEGTVTLATPLPEGMKLAILRVVPMVQESAYPEAGRFPAASHERALDLLTMEVQQLQELFTRTPYGPPTGGGSGAEIIASMSEWYEETKVNAADASGSAAAAAGSAASAAQSAVNAAADADRAARLVDPASLASSVYNVRKAFALENDIAQGGVLTLPGYYFPVRDVLFLSYNGTVCTPKLAGVEASGEYQYEEVGDDPDAPSHTVRLHFPATAGDVFDMWVVASAAGRNIEEIEALVAQAGEDAGHAAESAAAASTDADRAETAAAGFPDITAATAGQVAQARSVGGGLVAVWADAPGGNVSRLDTVLAAELPAGSAFSVPPYLAGSGKLQIFVGGVLCAAGESGDAAMYRENGDAGALSTSVTFFETLDAGFGITAIAAS